MSFDPRSLERLRQLGRTLPQPLPQPLAAPPPQPAPQPSGQGRHKVETETDPEALFRELMQASADGTVPPHLLDRLRQLEAGRRLRQADAGAGEGAMAPGSGSAAQPRPAQPRPAQPRPARQRDPAGQGRPDPRLAREHGDLYTAFQQLLLEDEEP
ncbi:MULTISPECIES: hypothetical protein [Aphanothece]|uniref:hypothetical protein n=1 Tax=Aphanothece TaxID=1121 RepID=UPI00398561EC